MNKDDILEKHKFQDDIFKDFIKQLGIDIYVTYNPKILTPEERIRGFCIQNKCGNYGTRYTCPPHNGSLTEIDPKLKKYQYGLLIQYSKSIIVKGNRKGVQATLLEFHAKILQIEEFLKGEGFDDVWGLIGGTCLLCEQCGATTGEPCRYPAKARPSLEALGIDVLKLLETLNLDNKFHKDKITWTGSILISDTP